MFSKLHLILLILGLLTVGAVHAGCSLHDDHKTACSVQGDCLDGFACVNHVCTDMPGPPDAGGPGNGGGPTDPDDWQSGIVEPAMVHTSGVRAINSNSTLLGITSASDNLGCAMVGSQTAAPGTGAAAIRVNLISSGDPRCPAGTFGLQYDLPACNPHGNDGPTTRCGVYQRWDASGQLVAERLALGGFVTGQDIVVDATTHRCELELSFNFGGTTAIQSTFSFEFHPGDPGSVFCLH
jgi:hypothetical protein